jgi:predicted transcriptional regulator
MKCETKNALDEWLDAAGAATTPSQGESIEELAGRFGRTDKAVAKLLRTLQAQGKLGVGSREGKNVAGRVKHTPVYWILKGKR